uniref:CBS domain-containing protein n=1 Tax=Romanomermis culicivorax TaxID=13658 RepID=A0A915JUP2_ROMCU
MLTITDFIQILHHYESQGRNFVQELEHNKIIDWKSCSVKLKLQTIDDGKNFFTSILHRAVRQLLTHKIHRLAVVCPQTNNMLYILTLKRVLRYLSFYVMDIRISDKLIKTPYNLLPSFVHQTPQSLGIGTYEDLVTIRYGTPLRQALSLFLQRKISALPILNDQDQVKDIYCKFDVINLVANNAFANLDLTLGEALRHRRRSAPTAVIDPSAPGTSTQQQPSTSSK